MSCSTKKKLSISDFWHILYFKEANRLYFDKNSDVLVWYPTCNSHAVSIIFPFVLSSNDYLWKIFEKDFLKKIQSATLFVRMNIPTSVGLFVSVRRSSHLARRSSKLIEMLKEIDWSTDLKLMTEAEVLFNVTVSLVLAGGRWDTMCALPALSIRFDESEMVSQSSPQSCWLSRYQAGCWPGCRDLWSSPTSHCSLYSLAIVEQKYMR